MKPHFLLLFISLFAAHFVSAQNQPSASITDSLIKVLQMHGKEDTIKVNLLLTLSREQYINHRFDSVSLPTSRKALHLAEKLNFKKGQAIALKAFGNQYTDLADSAKALFYYKKSIALYQQIKDYNGQITILINISKLYSNFLDYTQSVHYIDQAKIIAEKHHELSSLLLVHLEYGYVFYQTFDFPKALEHYQKAMDICEQANDKQNEYLVLYRTGELYYHLKEFDKTQECIEKIRTVSQETGNQRQHAFSYAWEGNLLMLNGKYKESLEQYNRAIEIRKKIGDEIGLASDYANVAVEYQMLSDYVSALKYHKETYKLAFKNNDRYAMLMYLKDMGRLIMEAPDSILALIDIEPTKRFQASIDYENKALKLAGELGDAPQKLYIWGHLLAAYEKIGDYKSALNIYKKSVALNDSMAGQNIKAEIARKEVQYAFEKKEAIAKSRHDKIIMRFMLWGGITLIIAIVGFSLYYITHLRKKKERQILLAQQRVTSLEKEKAEQELKQAQTDIEQFLKHISDKNAIIETISDELDNLKSAPTLLSQNLSESLSALRDKTILTNDDWLDFLNSFNKLYPDFTTTIKEKHPSITASELRYLMLSKLGLEHKEMAGTLGVTTDTIRVTWNRTRNKLNGTLEDTPHSLLVKMGINN